MLILRMVGWLFVIAACLIMSPIVILVIIFGLPTYLFLKAFVVISKRLEPPKME